MNFKKITAGILACAAFAGSAVYYSEFAGKDYSITASAEDYTTVHGEELSYDVYSDHIEISGFNTYSTITDVAIPSEIDGLPVTKITDMAFYAVSDITSIAISDGITEIGHNAFEGCSGLTEITIPESVTLINYSAFTGCTALASVTLPSGITSIESGTFRDCTSLASVTIPENVASIGEYAFYRSGLTEIVIPNAVTSIGAHAFAECESLVSAEIPGSVATIGGWAFDGCTALNNVVLGEGVQIIEMAAFQNTALASVIIPESVETVEMDSFSGENLMSVTVLNPEMNIGSGAFRINEGGTISGYPFSTAQTYASNNGITFEAIIDGTYMLGDVDNDGAVNSSDASAVLSEYALLATGGASSFTDMQKLAADVNTDGAIDSSDASTILSYYAYTSTGGTGSLVDFMGA